MAGKSIVAALLLGMLGVVGHHVVLTSEPAPTPAYSVNDPAAAPTPAYLVGLKQQLRESAYPPSDEPPMAPPAPVPPPDSKPISSPAVPPVPAPSIATPPVSAPAISPPTPGGLDIPQLPAVPAPGQIPAQKVDDKSNPPLPPIPAPVSPPQSAPVDVPPLPTVPSFPAPTPPAGEPTAPPLPSPIPPTPEPKNELKKEVPAPSFPPGAADVPPPPAEEKPSIPVPEGTPPPIPEVKFPLPKAQVETPILPAPTVPAPNATVPTPPAPLPPMPPMSIDAPAPTPAPVPIPPAVQKENPLEVIQESLLEFKKRLASTPPVVQEKKEDEAIPLGTPGMNPPGYPIAPLSGKRIGDPKPADEVWPGLKRLVDVHVCKPSERDFAAVSDQVYKSSRYGRALALFNQDYPTAIESLGDVKEPWTAGQKIFFPPKIVLEKLYPVTLGIESETRVPMVELTHEPDVTKAPLPVSNPIAETPSEKVRPITSPWTFHVEVIEGRNLLTAKLHKVIQFRVDCAKIDMQAPRGSVQASGNVRIMSPNLEVTSEKVVIHFQEDQVMVEGQAFLRCQRDGQEMEVRSDRFSLRLSESPGQTTTSSSSQLAPRPPTVRYYRD